MTLSTTGNLNRYTSTGAGTVYPYTYTILAADDLEVALTAAGVETILTQPGGYDVSGVGRPGGGSVTLTAIPPAGTIITIRRAPEEKQTVTLQTGGQFNAKVHERVFDRLTMIAQTHREELDRSLHLPIALTGISSQLPAPSPGMVLGWNADGTALVNYPQTGVGLILPFSIDAIAPVSVQIGGTTPPPTVVVRNAGGGIIAGPVLSFDTLDHTKATVDPVTGVMTGFALGTTMLRVTAGTIYRDVALTVVAVPYTIAMFRAAVTDARIKGLYWAGSIVPISGKVDVWPDVRGPGFGPDLVAPSAPARPPLLGTAGTASALVHLNGTGCLATAASAVFGTLQGARTVLGVGELNSDPAVFSFKPHVALQTAGATSLISSDFLNSRLNLRSNPDFLTMPNGSAIESALPPRWFGKQRTFFLSKDAGTTRSFRRYPSPKLSSGVFTAVTEAVDAQLTLGTSGTGAAAAGTDTKLRLVCVFNDDATDAEVAAFARLGYNPAVGGAIGTNNLYVACGDSITAHQQETGWVALIDRDPSMVDWDVTSEAQGGSVIADLVARAPQLDAALTETSLLRTNAVLTVWAGTNDIYNLSRTAAATWADFQAYCNARRAAGWYVIIITAIARGGGVLSGEMLAYRNLQVANWATCADDILDITAAVPTLADSSSAIYFDGIRTHPTDVTQPDIAAAVMNKVILAGGPIDPTPASVVVSPASPSIAAAATQAFTAVVRNAASQIIVGATVSWSSLAPGVATINSSTGVATGVSAGSATIRATAGAVHGDAALTVTAGAVTLASDTFNRADNASVLGSTDGGTLSPLAWTTHLGTFGISSNRAAQTAAAGTYYTATINPAVTDGKLTITIPVVDVAFAYGICARLSDASNFIHIEYSAGALSLYKRVAGSFTSLGSQTLSLVAGDTIGLKIAGNVISVYWNGALQFSATDSFNNTATRWGLVTASATQRYDSMVFTDI